MNLNLEGKKVLVTGGSKGIGKGIAEAFTAENAKVGVVARGEKDLEKTRQELSEVEIFQGDLSNVEERSRVFQEFIDTFGTIDILINNVGGSSGGSNLETSLEQFDEAMQLNYFSAVHFSQLAAPYMKKANDGAIVNISSIFGRESGGKPSYNSSKAAMISFTKSLADELALEGVRVNGVAPGAILHPTGNWQRRLDEDPEKIEKFVEDQIPAGRFGTVEEVADVVVFLASERAKWVIGATLNVDGGQSKSNF
ncbi:SDR family NAD(P)-dependent oxidoreductase [Salipaludibacillus aurantiacus]|uniref:3-oxoacyl-[acyl-carrier protein] reductase n=1 Tax=Salipaludibacillus aurantiacus TaxID=1601833 RepID=A0A1H9SMF3_9BACI|nr:SDR family oxidoreductase [Salipaludibacillus aurantiacus]SER86097.1 3-oxoacyl-[acyl-carrier protein] reductase [Salipaludibacillus aurantiacus]